MAEEIREITVPPAAAGERIDAFLAGLSPVAGISQVVGAPALLRPPRRTFPSATADQGAPAGHSRSFFKVLIKEGAALVNGRPVKPAYRVSAGDVMSIRIPLSPAYDFKELPFEVIYEDSSIIVINKPAGISVHPAGKSIPGKPTIAEILVSRAPQLSAAKPASYVAQGNRVGIVHRLDMDTSGVMVVAKTPEAAHIMSGQFSARTVEKKYLAIVCGTFEESNGFIDAPIGRDRKDKRKFSSAVGKEASTSFKVMKKFTSHTLLEITPHTGRTHQIRVHLSLIGHPVLGDKVYGGAGADACPAIAGLPSVVRRGGLLRRLRKACAGVPVARQMLHAKRLTINHPVTGKKMTFEAKIPADFESVLKLLGPAPRKHSGDCERTVVQRNCEKPARRTFRGALTCRGASGLRRFSRRMKTVIFACALLSAGIPRLSAENETAPSTAVQTGIAADSASLSTPAAHTKKKAQSQSASAARDNKELKKMSTELAAVKSGVQALKAEIQNVKTDAAAAGQIISGHELRIKESNLAIVELNRKLTELELSLEKFKSDVKMGAIDTKDRQSSVGALESEQKRFEQLEKSVSEKASVLEGEVSLVKTSLAQLQEKIGIASAAAHAREEEQSNAEDGTAAMKIKRIGSSPWAVVTALSVAVLALVIALAK